MTEAEVEAFDGKLSECPLCEETQCENHEKCFHCEQNRRIKEFFRRIWNRVGDWWYSFGLGGRCSICDGHNVDCHICGHPKDREFVRCACGLVLSEWFIKDGVMWCSPYARGCGRLSKFANHEEYRKRHCA